MPTIIETPEIVIVDNQTIEVISVGIQGPAGAQGPAGMGGNPGGSAGDIQFNGGSNTFAGSSSLHWNGSKLSTTGLQLTTSPTSNYVLTSDGSGNATWQAAPGGTPGGSNTDIQFNSSGSFAGSSALTWDGNKVNLGTVFAGRETNGIELGTTSASGVVGLSIKNDSSATNAITDFYMQCDLTGLSIQCYSHTQNSGVYYAPNATSLIGFGTNGILYCNYNNSGTGHHFRVDATNTTDLMCISRNSQSVLVNAGSSSLIGLTVKGASSQSANLQEWQNSSGSTIASVSSNGTFYTSVRYQSPSGTYYNSDGAGQNAFVMTSAGAHYGTIQQDGADLWSLGFSSTQSTTLGTPVIQWGASKVGFYGVTPISRAVLATGAGHTVDDVITALQNLGLVKQS